MLSIPNGNSICVGWFGKERGSSGRQNTQTHILENGKCLCGYKPAPSMKFQWCCDGHSYTAECKSCEERFHKKYVEVK